MNAEQIGPGPGGASAQVEYVLEHAPAVLRQRPQWVCWTSITRDGKSTKCPVSPRIGSNADSTNPTTWATFEEAVAAWRSNGYAGVGYVFTPDDPFCGIDLDDCINDDGNLVPGARAIVDEFDSYTEVSPSGRGVKVFITGRKPEGVGCRSKVISGFKEIEIYDRDRFFTVTGRHLEGTPKTVEDRQQPLEELCHRLWPATAPESLAPPHPSPPGCPDDEQLLAKARAATNGEAFSRLWEGDTSAYAGDDSAADLALCNSLAFWTGRNADRMDRLFRQSGLMRDKWDERRGHRTYGQMTIEKAILGTHEVLGSQRPVSSKSTVDAPAPPGDFDAGSGKLVLSPQQTLPTAQAYLRQFHAHRDRHTLVHHAGEFLAWRGNRYVLAEEGGLRHRLQYWLHGAVQWKTSRSGQQYLAPFDSNRRTVTDALDALQNCVHLPAEFSGPNWLDDVAGRPPAGELLPCLSCNLHLPTRQVLPVTPSLFTPCALDFDYAPKADPPERWNRFLDELFDNDQDARSLLQMWFGYCLTADTKFQKMLLIVGPKRSGKGTLARVLTRLVGAGNVTSPTVVGLAGNFGLQCLLGKSVAIVSDARFKGKEVSVVIERLLMISGEDRITVDRKYREPVDVVLPTRFTFLTNEVPQVVDASGAIASRFLILPLTRSFLGREDTGLYDTLCTELPGILNWAIEGWERLHSEGRFIEPASSVEARENLEELSSPVSAFVRDYCILDPTRRIPCKDLYGGWKHWCEQNGREYTGNAAQFGRDLSAAVPGVHRRRSTGQEGFYEGIELAECLP